VHALPPEGLLISPLEPETVESATVKSLSARCQVPSANYSAARPVPARRSEENAG
jgi:hypothetical protein